MKLTYLYTSRCHVKLCCELIAQNTVWLGVAFEDGFESLKLGAGGSFTMLDLVGDVREECVIVRIHGRDPRLVRPIVHVSINAQARTRTLLLTDARYILLWAVMTRKRRKRVRIGQVDAGNHSCGIK